MPDRDLAATVANLRRLRDEATPGPWRLGPEPPWEAGHGVVKCGCEPTDADADLIVAAVNALPSLLDAVEERDRLREGVELLREVQATTMARQSGRVRASTLGQIDRFLAALTEVDSHA